MPPLQGPPPTHTHMYREVGTGRRHQSIATVVQMGTIRFPQNRPHLICLVNRIHCGIIGDRLHIRFRWGQVFVLLRFLSACPLLFYRCDGIPSFAPRVVTAFRATGVATPSYRELFHDDYHYTLSVAMSDHHIALVAMESSA